MYRIIEYTVLFIAMVLLQVLLFDNLDFGIFLHPLVYVAFFLLLPMETPPVVVLLLGLLTGVVTDTFTGNAGLHTIASLLTTFMRPLYLRMLVGGEEVKEGGIPSSGKIGRGKFLRYCLVAVFIHCLTFFSLEALTWDFFHYTLLRTALSTILTVLLVWFVQMLFNSGTTARKMAGHER